MAEEKLKCAKCGEPLVEGQRVCGACGEPVRPLPEDDRGASAFPAERQSVVYAGFWLRAVSYILDTVIIALVATFVIVLPLVERGAIPQGEPMTLFANPSRQVIAIQLLVFMLSWLYFATFESSAWQATPGKRALRLRVVDLMGNRLTFTRASLRYLGKLVFGTIFVVGFVFAAFTPKKQALYDMLAGSLVIRTK